jgi:hypothetical protein
VIDTGGGTDDFLLLARLPGLTAELGALLSFVVLGDFWSADEDDEGTRLEVEEACMTGLRIAVNGVACGCASVLLIRLLELALALVTFDVDDTVLLFMTGVVAVANALSASLLLERVVLTLLLLLFALDEGSELFFDIPRVASIWPARWSMSTSVRDEEDEGEAGGLLDRVGRRDAMMNASSRNETRG